MSIIFKRLNIMKKVLTALSDRIVFTASFIIGIQLPAFINAYRQRLSGHLEEAKTQLQQYQMIADQQFNGSLESLVQSFISNSDEAIKNVGGVIQTTLTTVESYRQQLSLLNQENYLYQVFYFFKHIDVVKFRATIEIFTPAIPLSVEAIATGACFALITSFTLFWLIPLLITSIYNRLAHV